MENPKCGTCRCYLKSENTVIKPSGLYYTNCLRCRNKLKQYRENNREKLLEKGKQYRENNRGKLLEKGKQYWKNNREILSGKKKQYWKNNREILSEKNKQYRENNRGKLIEKGKQYWKNNTVKLSEKFKQYWKNNREKLLEKAIKYREDNKCPHKRAEFRCKECNLKQYLINLQRNQLKKCLKNSNLKKTKPSIEYLGCSAEYFMEFFKKKMDKFNLSSEIEMTWRNIHIDHIKPVSVFDLDNQDEFINCCNYTNLQPLLAEINLKKYNKWNDISDDFWLKNIIHQEYYDIYIP